ncbi:MAG: hypothetical protein D6689_10610 [Deltaproteobacteria bacterium]|nr:MAG: hypothetical protein D6689_10610 [Deltaproteobacteria bacterium]
MGRLGVIALFLFGVGCGGGDDDDDVAVDARPRAVDATADVVDAEVAGDARSPDATPAGMVLYGIVSGRLVTIDTTTGDASDVGAVGLEITRATWDEGSGTVYGVYDNTIAPKLATIDLCTGAATHAVNLTIPGNLIDGFDFEAASGTLYASVTADGNYPPDHRTEQLVTIDPVTGRSTVVANYTGTLTDGDVLLLDLPQPLAIDTDTSNSTVTLYDLSLASAAATNERTTGPPLTVFETVHQGVIYALGGDGAIEGQIVTLDPTTGVPTAVGGSHVPADVAALFSAPACAP